MASARWCRPPSGGASSARCCPAGRSTPRSSGSTARPTCSAATGTCATPAPTTRWSTSGYPRAIAGDWGGLRAWTPRSCSTGSTYLFGLGGDLLTLPRSSTRTDLDAGRRPVGAAAAAGPRTGCALPDDPRVEGARPDGGSPRDSGVRLVARAAGDRHRGAMPTTTSTHRSTCATATAGLHAPDAGYPRPLTDDWWNLPGQRRPGHSTASTRCSPAATTGPTCSPATSTSSSTTGRRWWSAAAEPADRLGQPPVRPVDAAFVGTDGKTYVFSGPQYVRYSSGDYTRIDDRYPAPIATFWGNVANTIARTGRVDAALGRRTSTPTCSPATSTSATPAPTTRASTTATRARSAVARSSEPRFANLARSLARAGRRGFRRPAQRLPVQRPELPRGVRRARTAATSCPPPAGCAFVEDGSVLVEEAGRLAPGSALEGTTSTGPPSGRARCGPSRPQFRTGLDAVLHGTDGNTYLFKGTLCYDAAVGRAYPFAEEWGRRATPIDQDNAVDAAFVGRDGRTYLFRGDQFVIYDGPLDGRHHRRPAPGRRVGRADRRRARLRRERAHLPVRAAGRRRHAAPRRLLRCRLHHPGRGLPEATDASFWEVPADRWPRAARCPDAVLFDRRDHGAARRGAVPAARRRHRRLVLPAPADPDLARPRTGPGPGGLHRPRRQRPTSSSTTSSPPTADGVSAAAAADPRRVGALAQQLPRTRRPGRRRVRARRHDHLPVLRRPVRRATPGPTTGSPTRATRGRSPATCARRSRSRPCRRRSRTCSPTVPQRAAR